MVSWLLSGLNYFSIQSSLIQSVLIHDQHCPVLIHREIRWNHDRGQIKGWSTLMTKSSLVCQTRQNIFCSAPPVLFVYSMSRNSFFVFNQLMVHLSQDFPFAAVACKLLLICSVSFWLWKHHPLIIIIIRIPRHHHIPLSPLTRRQIWHGAIGIAVVII